MRRAEHRNSLGDSIRPFTPAEKLQRLPKITNPDPPAHPSIPADSPALVRPA